MSASLPPKQKKTSVGKGKGKKPAKPLQHDSFNRDSSFVRFLKSRSAGDKSYSEDSSDGDDDGEHDDPVNKSSSTSQRKRGPKKLAGGKGKKAKSISSDEENSDMQANGNVELSDDNGITQDSSPSKNKRKRRAEDVGDDDELNTSALRKRRSSSLTPPPQLDKALMAESLKQLKQTFSAIYTFDNSPLRLNEDDDDGLIIDTYRRDNITASSASPITNDAPVSHDLDLDPELLRAHAEHQHQREGAVYSTDDLSPSSTLPQTLTQAHRNMSVSTGEKVEIKIKFVFDPRTVVTPENEEAINTLKKVVKIIIKDDDAFEPLIDIYCRIKNIPKGSLVLTYKKVKIFSRGTPASLGMFGKVNVEAYKKDTYQYIIEQENLARRQELEELGPLTHAATFEPSLRSDSGRSLSAEIENEGGEHQKDRIILKLRNKEGQDEKLRVNQTSTIQDIMAGYAFARSLPPEAQVRLFFEDVALEPGLQVMDTDLQDGDMVTVSVTAV